MTKSVPVKTEDIQLPPVVDGELATIEAVSILEKSTRPPARYTEGTLIEDMENVAKLIEDKVAAKMLRAVSGLGQASTRHQIIEDLKRSTPRRPSLLLVEKKGSQTYLVSTKEGREIVQFLPDEMCDPVETAEWESRLSAIVEGKDQSVAFENDIVVRVEELLARLKATNIPEHLRAKNTMASESSGGPPTKPMIAFAEKLAANNGTQLPRGLKSNFDICRKFIEEHKKAPNGENSSSGASGAPTPPMVSFAEKIAAAKGIELPKDFQNSFEVCRNFINAHKPESMPPSEKALEYAKSISQKKGLAIPPDTQADAKKLSAWINTNK